MTHNASTSLFGGLRQGRVCGAMGTIGDPRGGSRIDGMRSSSSSTASKTSSWSVRSRTETTCFPSCGKSRPISSSRCATAGCRRPGVPRRAGEALPAGEGRHALGGRGSAGDRIGLPARGEWLHPQVGQPVRPARSHPSDRRKDGHPSPRGRTAPRRRACREACRRRRSRCWQSSPTGTRTSRSQPASG